MHKLLIIALASALILLAACGGGGEGPARQGTPTATA
jgi:hypothetical protein